MNNKDVGGPAFPVTLPSAAPYKDHLPQDGMTLRDYFAAKAMQTLIGAMQSPNPSDVANWAYRHADAMLAERAK